MNYTHSVARRGKPKRLLDPSAAFITSSPMPQQSPQAFNQQVPINNGMDGMQQEYGLNIPNDPSTSYGFNPASVPSQPPYPNMENSMASSQFAAQSLLQPVVTNMAMQYGNAFVGSSKEKFEKYIPITAMRYYFAVDTEYVMTKLALLFFPFIHKDWTVKYEQDVPLQPRFEKNAPDMYIPTMAFLTYVVLAGLVLGTSGRFTPEQLGILASSALAWGIVELLVHTVTLYVMNLETSLSTLDLFAYCGYKYVGVNFALLIFLGFRQIGYYAILIYFSMSLGFFLMRSLKLRVIPQGHSSYSALGNKRRLYFIVFVAGVQPILMWWLSYHLI